MKYELKENMIDCGYWLYVNTMLAVYIHSRHAKYLLLLTDISPKGL